MKLIRDIRLYKSSESNKLTGIASKALNIAARRVAMKLREQELSLGEFDHLYINFTTCKPKGTFELIDKVDPYHPWFRYCDIGISQSEYDNLSTQCVYENICTVLISVFHLQADVVQNAIIEAQKGSAMLMRFKEKKSAKGTATIHLRLLDNGNYLPLLCVTDADGNEILRTDLPETIDLNIIGEVRLSNKKVVIQPRKNALATGLCPISFDL